MCAYSIRLPPDTMEIVLNIERALTIAILVILVVWLASRVL